MPLRLFPLGLALIVGAVYVLGGFEQRSDNFVGIHESKRAVEDGIVYALSEDRMYAAEDFVVSLTDPFRSTIDLPFD